MSAADAFSRCHPAVNLAFFSSAVVFAMCLRHPAFLAVSLAAGVLYRLIVHRGRQLRFLGGMFAVFCVVAGANPLFNTLGGTVLFTTPFGRPYTLEALVFGFAVAAQIVCVLLWFSGYNAVMTGDKLTRLLARLAPSTALVLIQSLTLVPVCRRKLGELRAARTCIGKGAGAGPARVRLERGAEAVSALSSWALEGAVVRADSIKGRGFGAGPRSSYAPAGMDARDKALLAAVLVLSAAVLAAALGGAARADYIPELALASLSPLSVAGLAAYAMLLAIPSALDAWELVQWRISLSKV